MKKGKSGQPNGTDTTEPKPQTNGKKSEKPKEKVDGFIA